MSDRQSEQEEEKEEEKKKKKKKEEEEESMNRTNIKRHGQTGRVIETKKERKTEKK
jgi:hypothetical protein